uniref:Capsule synthesis protein CapA domain-containing protein n=1 Tax=Amphora coffeiformis TaxID=265554 RepID=A0A7S3L9J8_9STRA
MHLCAFAVSLVLPRSQFARVLVSGLLGASTAFSVMSSKPSNQPQEAFSICLLFHGGDNMLGRAVQLSFPTQAPGEENISDSCRASHYVHMSLNHPSGHKNDPPLEEIRRLNQNGQYLWGDYISPSFTITPPPDIRILNLETAVTTSIHNPDVPLWKGIRYHLHINNLEPAMKTFQQQTHGAAVPSPVVVSYANNHCMDYGRQAFDQETLPAFQSMEHIFSAVGCGRNLQETQKTLKIPIRKEITVSDPSACQQIGTIEIAAFSSQCSGTPKSWGAADCRSGVLALPGIYDENSVKEAMQLMKPALDKMGSDSLLRVVSIHWGPNWAMKNEDRQQLDARRTLAHRLIDECGVDLIYGHSSHHARGMEVYNKKLVLYGTGDAINDYEGFENPGEDRYNRLGGIFIVNYLGNNFQQLSIVPTFMNRLRLERWTTESKIWHPNSRRLEADPDKSKDFCSFLNKLSRIEAGSEEAALLMENVEADPKIPGGPVLKSNRYNPVEV